MLIKQGGNFLASSSSTRTGASRGYGCGKSPRAGASPPTSLSHVPQLVWSPPPRGAQFETTPVLAVLEEALAPKHLFNLLRVELTFPKCHHSPSKCHQLSRNPRISSSVLGKLAFPEVRLGLGYLRHRATLVEVPEAAVHEDGRAISGKDYVGRSGQVLSMQPKAPAITVQGSPHCHLRACVARLEARHQASPLPIAQPRHGIVPC